MSGLRAVSDSDDFDQRLQKGLCASAGDNFRHHMRFAKLLVCQQSTFATDQFVMTGCFQKPIVDSNRFHQANALDALDVHVELLFVAVARVDDLHFCDRHLLVPSLRHRTNVVECFHRWFAPLKKLLKKR